LPLSRSRQIVSRLLPSNAVTKMRSLVKTGEECPPGNAVLQRMFFCGPKCSGRPLEGETPEPFGPRNCVQSAAARASGINRQGIQRTAISVHLSGLEQVYRGRLGPMIVPSSQPAYGHDSRLRRSMACDGSSLWLSQMHAPVAARSIHPDAGPRSANPPANLRP